MKKTILIWWMFAAVFAGCGEATAPSAPTETVDADMADGKGDGPGNWKARTTGLTMWVDTVMTPETVIEARRERTYWTIAGRVSKTLTNVRAYDAAGRAFDAKMVSARKFEIRLDEPQVIDVLAGERLYLDLFAERGEIPLYHAMVRFGARFTDWAGSNEFYVYRAINPVVVGNHLKFRGRASASGGYSIDGVFTERRTNPTLFDDEPRKYHFDWSPRALHITTATDETVEFRGSDVASTPVLKTAKVELRLVQMGLGTDAPLVAWPKETCDREVRACLATLTSADTEVCGWANQVRACGGDTASERANADQFVEDLGIAITHWYELHEAEVRAMNGRTLRAALDAIDAGAVGTVTDEDEVDMFGYDPDHFDLMFHADPVFPGSARVWYGVYDHAGGLVSIESVN